MDTYFIGSIIPWAVNFVPVGWLYCNGQSLPTQQYQVLFSLLGYRYGGSGTTFNLPNLQGLIPVGADMGGVSTATTAYPLGTQVGSESVSLTQAQLPNHTHPFAVTGVAGGLKANVSIPAVSTDASTAIPGPTTSLGLAKSGGKAAFIYSTNASTTYLKSFSAPVTGTVSVTGTINNAGTGVTLENRQPYVAVNYIICNEGVYPVNPN